MPSDPGLDYRGLVGQKELVKELMRCSYSMNLQSRLEPFGMVITESMRAGCIVIASPVGAYAELVRDGEDGFLIQGDHEVEETREKTAKLIFCLWIPTLAIAILGIGPDILLAAFMYISIIVTLIGFAGYLKKAFYVFTD